MDYARFVDLGDPHWTQAARLLGQGRALGLGGLDLGELEELAAHHRRVVSDFAFARTHFGGTEAERRLRALAFDGHRLLAQRRPPLGPRLWRFLVDGYPRVFRESIPSLMLSMAVFATATLAGFVITTLNTDFSLLWLGPEAIDGLRHGEIWTDSIGSLVPPTLLSTQIFTNNISVALVTWLSGVTLGLGTLYLLGMNGMMFGSVLALGWRYEMLDRVFAFVSGHGPLELFLIMVAGAAGLQLARGQLVWSNRPQAETFPQAGRSSLLLMAGTLPWFVLLGLVEGHISPVMSLATGVKVALGIGLVLLFLAYGLRPLPPLEGRT